MRFSICCIALFIVVACAIQAQSAPVQLCSTSQTYDVNVTTGTYGCSGGTARVTVIWNFSNDMSRFIDWSLSGYSDSYVTISRDGVQYYGPFNPNQNSQYYFPKGYAWQFKYYVGTTSMTSYGTSFSLSKAPDSTPIVSGQLYNVTAAQSGGFVYFAFPQSYLGRQLAIDIEIYSYQGLREPTMFVSRNRAPTLERYEYTNGTVQTAEDRYSAVLFINNPTDGAWFIGMYLYGSAASMSIMAQWTFNVQMLTSGVKVSRVINQPDYYQILVPVNTKNLKFQISRQEPGGNPVAYISQGSMPSATNYEWKADTGETPYIVINIPNPNPIGNKSPNPGNYLFAIYPSSGTTSGYIIQADWA